MKYFFICSLLFYLPAIGQLNNNCYPNISAYVKHIDSLYDHYSGSKSKYEKDFYIRGISDGVITTFTETLTDSIVGGSSTKSFTDRNGNVYFLQVADNMSGYLIRKYYYLHNQLIYATMELSDWATNPASIIYKREEFFEEKKLLSQTSIDYRLKDKDRRRIQLSLYQEGEEKLKEYKKQ
ncbi:hypothetical protein [Chitinophaga silvatica]|nr:hypothetical protein [Chitinophaga silvatica]